MKRIIRRTLALAIALMLAMPFTVGLADEGLPCVDVEADASAVEAAGEPSGDAAEDAPADIDAAEDGLSLEDALAIEAECRTPPRNRRRRKRPTPCLKAKSPLYIWTRRAK